MNDNDEFMNLAKADTHTHAIGHAVPPSAAPSGSDRRSGVFARPVQFTSNGTGFIPVGATVPTLPAGTYRLQTIDDIISFVPQEFATDDLVRLPDSTSDAILTEIERFWPKAMKDSFQRFGFTHKRGILLWGPAGSGKTSTVKLVVEHLVAHGGVVLVMSASITPRAHALMLHALRAVEPERQVLVLVEDIDTIIQQHGEADVLSLLDGELSIDNVVYLATTNYPEKLDGRVVNRPSRFDRVVKIGVPSAAARRVYLASRVKDALSASEMTRWVEATDGLSVAHLKELIVGVFCYGKDFGDEVSRLKGMARTPKSSDSDRATGFVA